MGKDSALGHDPLRWMRVTKENKKSPSTEDVIKVEQNIEKAVKKTIPQITIKQQKTISTNNDRTQDIQKAPQLPHKVNNVVDDQTKPKPKIVIGRMYEKPTVEKLKQPKFEDSVSKEPSRYTEQPPTSYKTMLPIKSPDYSLEHVPSYTSAFSLSTYIIIAYTTLILMLGFFVYMDISKRTSRIEARISAIEKVLHSK